MTLAIALSLVLIVSTVTLLYQYWTSALAASEAARDGESAATSFPARPQHPSRIDARPRPDAGSPNGSGGNFRADTAA